MHDLVQVVFSIIGVMVISLILFGMIFGGLGQTQLWSFVERGLGREWNELTMNNGTYRSAVLTDVGVCYEQSPTGASWGD